MEPLLSRFLFYTDYLIECKVCFVSGNLSLSFSLSLLGCEDYICSCISTDNLMSILHWSSQPHGSSWVWRQAMHFLREEFISIAASPVLFELHESLLIETLRSDFVQVCLSLRGKSMEKFKCKQNNLKWFGWSLSCIPMVTRNCIVGTLTKVVIVESSRLR